MKNQNSGMKMLITLIAIVISVCLSGCDSSNIGINNEKRMPPIEVNQAGNTILYMATDGRIWNWGSNATDGKFAYKFASKPLLLKGLNNVKDAVLVATLKKTIIISLSGHKLETITVFTENDSAKFVRSENKNLRDVTRIIFADIIHGFAFERTDGTVWYCKGFSDKDLSALIEVKFPSHVKAFAFDKRNSYMLDDQGEVFVWNQESNSVKPTQISNIRQMVSNDDSVLFLKNDGTVWGIGNNAYYLLGDSSIDEVKKIIKIKALKDIVKILCSTHALALNSKGDVYEWGLKDDSNKVLIESIYDVLENPRVVEKNSIQKQKDFDIAMTKYQFPAQKIQIKDKISNIATGSNFSALITKDGKLMCRGMNFGGLIDSNSNKKAITSFIKYK